MAKQYLVVLFAATVMLVATANTDAQDDGLALTPPMGWNSWGRLGCEGISEDVIKEIADAMVSSGMKDAGYEYVVIDDCWQVDRDEEGNIIPDPERFPSGMKSLADYVHSRGLKFGLYSCAGVLTCAKRPGSSGYEFQDAQQYADWGVDFLKYDWCTAEDQDSVELYSLMRNALKKTGRPIVFSICEWGDTKPWLWAKGIGHLWRIHAGWEKDWATKTVDFMDQLAAYAGPGHWNDPDFLQVGNFFNGNPSMDMSTKTECQAHFSLWCILAAPLMASNDIRTMSADVAEILTNKEVIAVNQDSLGIQGRKVRDDGDLEVWAKQLDDGGRAVVLFNRGNSDEEISVSWSEIGYPNQLLAEVRDLWLKKDLGQSKGSFAATVPSHGVVMVRIMPAGGDEESTISDRSSEANPLPNR